MLVDRERMVLLLRQRLLEKHSWGQRELLLLVTELEVECAVDQGEIDRTARLLFLELEETLFNRAARNSGSLDADPALDAAAGGAVMATSSDHREGATPPEGAPWNPAQPVPS